MSEDQIRKDFEEWMGDGGLSPRAIERNSKGDYIFMQAANAWEVWNAAQALNHARKLLKKEQEMEGQPQADGRDAERYRWLRDEWLGNEPEAINMERAKGQRGLDAAIDAAIAEAKENK